MQSYIKHLDIKQKKENFVLYCSHLIVSLQQNNRVE